MGRVLTQQNWTRSGVCFLRRIWRPKSFDLSGSAGGPIMAQPAIVFCFVGYSQSRVMDNVGYDHGAYSRPDWEVPPATIKEWSEVPGPHPNEDVHSETASSPYSTSGTLGSDATPSPEIKRSGNDDEGSAESNHQLESKPEFSQLKVDVSSPQPEPPIPLPSTDLEEPVTIELGAKFNSFAHFESVFKPWMNKYYHPFRVASSEQMRHPNGTPDPRYRYRYIVYHCVHYGNPRMRGNGKRPNQSYLPSGCKAMLRLNFNYHENKLRITSLTTEHKNHEIGPEHFGAKRPKISPHGEGSIKKESPGSRSSKSSCSHSSKSSPATTTVPTWSPSNPVSASSDSKESSFQPPVPSLATILASAYGNSCPVYPQHQQVNPILQHSLPMTQGGDLNPPNSVLGQKENFCIPSNVTLPPIAQLSQFPGAQINLPVLQLQQSNVAQTQTQDNVMMKVLEIFQRSSIMNIIEQYKKVTQDKVRTLQDEYRQLLSTLSSCPISSDPAIMEHMVSSLRSLTDFVQQNLPKP
ncbi:hypothetical protein FO519_008669 [Halicephalobus sp. NKZ332]|nr:hypothetical protein FO519_008669 [Halicephalobus sp. NKZ332]